MITIDKLNTRSKCEESREPEDFLVVLVISFNIEKNDLDAYITSSGDGWDYETAIDNMTPGTKYTEYFPRNIKEVRLLTFIDPDKYSCWLELYEDLEEALKRAEHYINWGVYDEEVKKNLLAEINKYRKHLKAKEGKFKRF